MPSLRPLLCACALLALCGPPARAQEQKPAPQGLLEARKGFKTKLSREVRDQEPLDVPPPALFELVTIPAPGGELKGMLGRRPIGAPEGTKSPAIVWLTGGFPGGGWSGAAWSAPSPDNEQSAQAYRQAGLVMLYPTYRGTCGNPGQQESFLGEVDDVLAAVAYLRKVPYVDPARVYVGGHSTGGTLALLVATTGADVRGVIAFGPVEDPTGYGAKVLTYDPEDEREAQVRAPIHYLRAVRAPTFVIEGDQRGNVESLRTLKKANQNPLVTCVEVKGASHFDLLGPLNQAIAKALAAHTEGALRLDPAALQRAFDDDRVAAQEASDLVTLARLRRRGLALEKPCETLHHCYGRDKEALTRMVAGAQAQGFTPGEVTRHTDEDGDPYFYVVLKKQLTPGDLPKLFATTRGLERLARAADVSYEGWSVD